MRCAVIEIGPDGAGQSSTFVRIRVMHSAFRASFVSHDCRCDAGPALQAARLLLRRRPMDLQVQERALCTTIFTIEITVIWTLMRRNYRHALLAKAPKRHDPSTFITYIVRH